jgi:hypothetical protein
MEDVMNIFRLLRQRIAIKMASQIAWQSAGRKEDGAIDRWKRRRFSGLRSGRFGSGIS